MNEFRARLRAFEESLQARMKEFQCSVHLCLGQEAVPAAIYQHARAEDWVFSTHRSHGHYLAKGGSEDKLLAEIEGREDGVNGGYSGSQSFCDPELRFHSTAIVGGLIAPATGAALAVKLSCRDEVVICCLGDAATEQGVFWESLNYAVLEGLPVVYVVENNGLSVHAPLKLRQARSLGPRVEAFGALYLRGVTHLREILRRRNGLPAVCEVICERECNHVSAMEDLRE